MAGNWWDDAENGPTATLNSWTQPQPSAPAAPAVDNSPYGPSANGPVATLAPTASSYMAPPPYQSGSNPLFEARLAQQSAEQNSINSRMGFVNASNNWVTAQQNTLPYRQATVNAQQATLPYRQGVVNAEQNTLPYRQATVAAQGGVLNAQAGEQGVLQAQIGENQTQAGEYAREQAALNNPADQSAIAEANRYRAATDAQNRSYGITPEADVLLPAGANPATTPLAPGTRAANQTEAQNVARLNAAAQQTRGFGLQGQQLGQQLNMSVANLASGRAQNAEAGSQVPVTAAQYTEQGAEIPVAAAQYAEQGTQIPAMAAEYAREAARAQDFGATAQVSQAGLDVTRAETPPQPGMVHAVDPNTGIEGTDWVTPAEAAQAQQTYQQNNAYANIGPSTALSEAQATARLQAQNGGAPLAGVPTADLLGMYNPLSANGESTNPNDRGQGTLSEQELENELTRRLVAVNKLSPDQARTSAQAMINQDRLSKIQAAERARSGRPTAVSPTG